MGGGASTWQSRAGPGMVWHGMVWHGMAWYGTGGKMETEAEIGSDMSGSREILGDLSATVGVFIFILFFYVAWEVGFWITWYRVWVWEVCVLFVFVLCYVYLCLFIYHCVRSFVRLFV